MAEAAVKTSRITKEKWEEMLEAYREKPTIAYIQQTCDVGAKLARRAVNDGFPHMGLHPFKEIQRHDVLVAFRRLRDQRHELEKRADAAGDDATIRQAQDAELRMLAQRIGVRAGHITVAMFDRALDLIEQGRVDINEITPRTLSTLGRMADSVTAVLDRVQKFGREDGAQQTSVAVQIAVTLEQCTKEELVTLRSTGRLPARILGLPETYELSDADDDRTLEPIEVQAEPVYADEDATE